MSCVHSLYCRTGSYEPWSEGHWCLLWQTTEAKIRVWEEFREAMEKNFQLVSVTFWRRIWWLGAGLYPGCVQSARRTANLDRGYCWAEKRTQLECPLTLESSSTSFAEVSEAFWKLLSSKEMSVNEILPKMLKAFDISLAFLVDTPSHCAEYSHLWLL